MRLLVIIPMLMLHVSYAQLYLSKSKSWDHYVELFKDSARVEVFKSHCHHWCFTRYVHNEILLPKRSGDTLFSGKQTHILKKKGSFILVHKSPYKNKYVKRRVDKCAHDKRDSLRKLAYYRLKTDYMHHLRDSLDGPIYPIMLSSGPSSVNWGPQSYPFGQYSSLVDKKIDSICAEIIRNKGPEIDAYYQKIDSLKFIDSATVFKLLANTNYELSCGKYLLKQLAKERPELLVRYIDRGFSNDKVILRAIRDHNANKEITRRVRSCPLKTAGKEQIVKQRINRVSRDVGFVTLYSTLVLAQLSLLALLIIAIVR